MMHKGSGVNDGLIATYPKKEKEKGRLVTMVSCRLPKQTEDRSSHFLLLSFEFVWFTFLANFGSFI